VHIFSLFWPPLFQVFWLPLFHSGVQTGLDIEAMTNDFQMLNLEGGKKGENQNFFFKVEWLHTFKKLLCIYCYVVKRCDFSSIFRHFFACKWWFLVFWYCWNVCLINIQGSGGVKSSKKQCIDSLKMKGVFLLCLINFFKAKISVDKIFVPYGAVWNFAFLQYDRPSSSIFSLCFKAKGVKFCTQTSHIHAKKVITRFLSRSWDRVKKLPKLY